MGKRNRERIKRIEQGKEAPISCKVPRKVPDANIGSTKEALQSFLSKLMRLSVPPRR